MSSARSGWNSLVLGAVSLLTADAIAQGPIGSVTYRPYEPSPIPTMGGPLLILSALLLAFVAIRFARSHRGAQRAAGVIALVLSAVGCLYLGIRVIQVHAVTADLTIEGAECTAVTTETYDPTVAGTRISSTCDNLVQIADLQLDGGCTPDAPGPETCNTGKVLGNSDFCELPSCTAAPPVAGDCQGGAVKLSTSPGGDMVVCDDPTDTVCEQDIEQLCPTGMQLCTATQLQARNDGWSYPVGSGGNVVVGEIYCRTGGGAGHFTMGPYGGATSLASDIPFNCGYGSSRPSCTSTYGCNEETVQAVCCLPTPSCGNGVVDSPEELCDDGNLDEADDCLNTCTWRVPGDHGISCS